MKNHRFNLSVTVSALHIESAQNKLSEWLEPSLALKKNQNIKLSKISLDKTDLNVSRSEGASDESDEWDDDWEGRGWDDLEEGSTATPSPTTSDADDDWEDDDGDWEEELSDIEDEDDEFGLSALKILQDDIASSSLDDDDEEGGEDEWGLKW
tara:strand:+ start:3240 stop:3698 length:459 start_codon:yes stop_codon:yes gene_type:complete